MADFWKSLREAADAYRTLAGMHQQELRAAADQLQSAHHATTDELRGALQSTVDGWGADAAALQAALDETVRQQLLQAHPLAAPDRAQAVLDRLQQARPDRAPLGLTVLDWDEQVGLVIFSDHIFLSTGLLGALPDDSALAFVIAHEAAHIDLGHNQLDSALLRRLPPLPVLPLHTGLRLAARAWMRPEMEKDADEGGLTLAIAAGFQPDGFEAVFDALGEDARSKELDALVSRDLGAWGEFWMQKATGYPSLEERRQRLRAIATRRR